MATPRRSNSRRMVASSPVRRAWRPRKSVVIRLKKDCLFFIAVPLLPNRACPHVEERVSLRDDHVATAGVNDVHAP